MSNLENKIKELLTMMTFDYIYFIKTVRCDILTGLSAKCTDVTTVEIFLRWFAKKTHCTTAEKNCGNVDAVN